MRGERRLSQPVHIAYTLGGAANTAESATVFAHGDSVAGSLAGIAATCMLSVPIIAERRYRRNSGEAYNSAVPLVGAVTLPLGAMSAASFINERPASGIVTLGITTFAGSLAYRYADTIERKRQDKAKKRAEKRKIKEQMRYMRKGFLEKPNSPLVDRILFDAHKVATMIPFGLGSIDQVGKGHLGNALLATASGIGAITIVSQSEATHTKSNK